MCDVHSIVQNNPYVLYFHIVALLKLIRKTHEVTEMHSCPNHTHLCVHFVKTYLFGKSRIHIYIYIYTPYVGIIFVPQKKFLTFWVYFQIHVIPCQPKSPTLPLGAARIEWHHWSSWLETFVGSLTLPGSQKALRSTPPQKKGGWNFEDVFFWGGDEQPEDVQIFCFDVVYPCLLPRQFWSGFKKRIYKQIEFSFGGGGGWSFKGWKMLGAGTFLDTTEKLFLSTVV